MAATVEAMEAWEDWEDWEALSTFIFNE